MEHEKQNKKCAHIYVTQVKINGIRIRKDSL